MADVYDWEREESRDASRWATGEDAPTLAELLREEAVCEACGGHGAVDLPGDDGCAYAAICLECADEEDL